MKILIKSVVFGMRWNKCFIRNFGGNKMKIINGKQLSNMPDGTVFSEIVDRNFDPNGGKWRHDY